MTAFLEALAEAIRSGEVDTDDRGKATDVLTDDLRVLHVTPGFVESRHVVGLFVDPRGTIRAVAKTPRREHDDEGVKHEATLLTRLHDLAPQLSATVPTVLAFTNWYGRPVLVESALTGKALTHERARRHPSAVASIHEWITRLPVTSRSSGATMIEELLTPSLERLRQITPADHPLHDVAARTEETLHHIDDMDLPRPFEHGDPSHPNLMVTRDGSAQVVDWELARENGAPGHDLAFFLGFTAFATRHAHGIPAEVAAFTDGFLRDDGTEARLFTDGLRSAGVDASAAGPLFLLAWARASLRLIDRLAPDLASTSVDDRAQLLAELERSRNTTLWVRAVTAGDGVMRVTQSA
jgi:hypothetical protein